MTQFQNAMAEYFAALTRVCEIDSGLVDYEDRDIDSAADRLRLVERVVASISANSTWEMIGKVIVAERIVFEERTVGKRTDESLAELLADIRADLVRWSDL